MSSTAQVDAPRLSSSQHIPALDGVRGLAVLLVLFHNTLNLPEAHRSAPARALILALDSGWCGVQLFFVLSGFLITGILCDTRESEGYYRAFFGRRVLRIFPLYYGVLLLWLLLSHVAAMPPAFRAGAEHQIWLWTYLSNWTAPYGRGLVAFPHFWSLAVEEQFYLVWPLVVHALAPRRLFVLCGGLVVAAFASRAVMLLVLHTGPEPVYLFTICRMDALAMGAMAAITLREPTMRAWLAARRRALDVSVAIVAVVGVVAVRDYTRVAPSSQLFGYSILALLFTWLVVAAVLPRSRGRAWHRFFSSGPMRSLGKYSYGIYVLHMPLNLFIGVPLVRRLAPAGPSLGLALAYVVVAVLASWLVAVASYHLLEKHFLALKRYFVPSPVVPLASA